jgi:PEP-CTERM motif-containing protein
MKRALKFAIMAAMFVALSATSAMADGTNLVYTLTQEGSSTPLATWEMPLNPTPSCDFSPPSPCSISGDAFFFTAEVSIDGAAPVADTLLFLNTTPMPVDLSDFSFLIPELTGSQLYSGDESAPMMIIPASGFFTLIDDGANNPATAGTEYTLAVSETPEPATLLLLGSGLVAFGMRKRRAAR